MSDVGDFGRGRDMGRGFGGMGGSLLDEFFSAFLDRPANAGFDPQLGARDGPQGAPAPAARSGGQS